MTSDLIKKAVELSVQIRKNAHAVYSNFFVGAVVITKSGKIYPGVNVENSSYGATVCAERVAIFNAITDGHKDIEAVVIASNLNGKAAFPCGVCRQVLADFNPDMDVYLVNSETGLIENKVTLSEIFPEHFEFHK